MRKLANEEMRKCGNEEMWELVGEYRRGLDFGGKRKISEVD